MFFLLIGDCCMISLHFLPVYGPLVLLLLLQPILENSSIGYVALIGSKYTVCMYQLIRFGVMTFCESQVQLPCVQSITTVFITTDSATPTPLHEITDRLFCVFVPSSLLYLLLNPLIGLVVYLSVYRLWIFIMRILSKYYRYDLICKF